LERLERELSAAKEELAGIVEASADFIALATLEGRLSFLNDAGRALIGMSATESLEGSVLLLGDLFEEGEQALAAARETGRWESEGHLKVRSGPPIAVWYNVFALRDPETGAVRGLATVSRDLRRQKSDELKLRASAADLERRVAERTRALEVSNRELEAFSYSVSHDLRAPIRHINGFTELLEKHALEALDARSMHYLQTIKIAAKQAGTLIDDLLAFSRVSRTEVNLKEVDLAEITGIARLEVIAEAGGRQIEWQIKKLPKVVGDPAMLRLVMRNLLSNAMKYSKRQAQPVVEIGSTTHDAEVEVYVKDNGVGFDMTHVDKLFGVFQRLHRSEDFEGTGIGLANVRRIVERHGGHTWAEGAVGQGATFRFTLPLSPHGGGAA
jgi:signal transduction histidine kinase